MLIPLISDWKVPKECIHSLTGDVCEKPLRRLYVLEEPVQGFKVVGVCEEHHQALQAASQVREGESDG